MKLFLLFMLISLTSFAQGVSNPEPTGIELDDEVIFLQILKEFAQESRKEGLYIDHHISKDLGAIRILTPTEMERIDKRFSPTYKAAGITYLEVRYDILGYWHRTPIIGIRSDMMFYEYKLIKMIIYHELGHFFGVDHLETEEELAQYEFHVMCPVLTKDNIKKTLTDEAMKDYWKMIRESYHKKRWKRMSNNT